MIQRTPLASMLAVLPENLLEMHLGSPVISPVPDPVPVSNPSDRLHLTLADFPVRQLPLTLCSKIAWTVPLDAEGRLSKITPSQSLDQLPTREPLVHGSLIYKLRVIALEPNEGKSLSDHEWMKRQSVWPKNIFIEVNGRRMEIRRIPSIQKPRNG